MTWFSTAKRRGPIEANLFGIPGCGVFHGLNAVAPLKRSGLDGQMIPGVFHGLNAVAPLKLRLPLGKAFSRFPRPKRRGPIEAGVGSRGRRSNPVFHGLNAVAPLKRHRVVDVCARHRVFHGLNAVAPLKRHRPAPYCRLAVSTA